MPASAADHRSAAALAAEAGRRLLRLRERHDAEDADARRRKDEGDRASHEYLAGALAEQFPDDVVLSEEQRAARAAADPERLDAERVWVIDPLDGTREYSEPGRADWAVHVALVVDHRPVAAAVALPAQGLVLGTSPPPSGPPPPPPRPRLVVSRTRPPALARRVADQLGGDLVEMGSAGAKTMAVVMGAADVYLHDGGQYEWDSAAPVGVALAAGLHASRLDGAPLRYNNPDPYLPDLLVCRPDLADRVLTSVKEWSVKD